jgi:hypothetical protein
VLRMLVERVIDIILNLLVWAASGPELWMLGPFKPRR